MAPFCEEAIVARICIMVKFGNINPKYLYSHSVVATYPGVVNGSFSLSCVTPRYPSSTRRETQMKLKRFRPLFAF